MDAVENKHSYYNWVEIIAYSGLYEYKYEKDRAYKAIVSRMTANCDECDEETLSRIEVFAKAVTHVDDVSEEEVEEELELE